jgi:eukaryotic-like serine/threonine-protein kinase
LASGFSEERWRTILELSEQVAPLPAHERSAYLIAAGVGSEVSVEVLELAAQFHEENPEAPPADARLGTTVGRFRITGVLGSGGMGDVYSARDTELDRPVALKFLRPEALGYDPAYPKLIREAQTASSLNHPNIVTIYEIVRTGSTIAIVMELVEGASLRVLCGERREGISRVFDMGEQIASALGAAHGRGIVHRDIKPENVLVQTDGRLKVLDFGLARRISNAAGASSLYPAGTLRYLSPEQARGDAAGPASDVFSLGLVLHELATGRHPFAAGSPFDTVYAILHGEPERLGPGDRIPRPFAELVESMLSKNPSDRPSANEVARTLGEMRRGVAVETRKATFPYQRTVIWAALAIALVGVGVAWMKLRPAAAPDFRNLRIQPLTSQPGWEADPAFSPDGESVAFTWNDRPEDPQMYVKRLDTGEAVRLTDSDTGEIGALAWSPDGRQIAFKRQLHGLEGAIHAVLVAGGAELPILNLANANETSSIDWSPDGKKLIFSDQPPGSTQLAIYSFNLQTGEKIKLTTPPAAIWGDWSPKFSPDGKTIAFKRVTDYWLDEIYLIPAAGGAARQMTSIKAGIWGHAWTANGDSLIVSCQRGSTVLGIWRFPLADPLRPERIQQGAGDLITPATARKANRIAWVSRVWDTNIYRAPIAGSDPPVKLIASTQRDQNPAVAPDGRIAFVSDRSGSREIWMAAADGGNQTKVTDFGGPQIDNLMWSPDGRRLAFNSRLRGQAGVFTMECRPEARRCGEPQMFITGASAPAWSADGTAIFYSSNRAGSQQVWRHPLDGGPDTAVTPSGANLLRQSRDGKWLYLSKTPAETIYRTASRSPAGAMAAPIEPVIDASIRVLPMGWDMAPSEVLFFEMLTKQQRWRIRAVSIASGRVRFVSDWGESYAGADGMVLSVSRDGKWVYYPRLDSAGANIMVAESVR